LIDLVSLAHNNVLVIILGTIYIILAMGTAYYCVIATKTDPSDPTIALEERCKETNIPFDSDRYEYHC
jgi:hypothetical protein